MPRSVKPADLVDVDAFFAGVDDVRAYLNRRVQHPARRRERLAKVAAELLKPREARVFAAWLTEQLSESLGATAARCWVWQRPGEAPLCWVELGTLAQLDTAARLLATAAALELYETGLFVPLCGLERLVGAIWLELSGPVDDGSRSLLQAIADAAGAALERALLMQVMAK